MPTAVKPQRRTSAARHSAIGGQGMSEKLDNEGNLHQQVQTVKMFRQWL